MSQKNDENGPADDGTEKAKREEIAEVDAQLDAQADGEGLAAEAGRGEETGLSEG
jgi:hypothetical protein